MARILVIEDDADINELLCRILRRAGYEVTAAYSGTEAGLCLERESPELVLLDLMLPGMCGEEVIRRIRRDGLQTPVIVLSAKISLESKVEAMTLGADDYMTKPFEPEEVLVRVMAALRRSRNVKGGPAEEEPEQYRYKKLSLDPQSRSAQVAGQELVLTRYEYDILLLLLSKPDKVFSRETLYEQVWRNGYYGEDNTVNVHVSNIRKKIAAQDPGEEYIKTVWGIGFKLA